MKYEALQAKYGEPAEKEVAEPEGSVEEAEKMEAPLPSAADEPSAEGVPTEPEPQQTPDQSVSEEAVEPPKPHREEELQTIIKEQREAFAAIGRTIQMLGQKVAAVNDSLEQMKQGPSKEVSFSPLVDKIEELRQANLKQEEINRRVLQDSRNYQATVSEKMQAELERYRKMHADMAAYAPILTGIANLYIASCKAIGFLKDERERKNVSEIVLEGMLEFFEDHGVAVNSTPVGEKRSVKTCKTRKTIPTGNPELNGTVAESIHPSFTLGNQVLVKESIDTYVYDASIALPKEEPEMPAEDPEAKQEESAAASDVSSPEGGNATEGIEPESATGTDEGATEADTLIEGNE